MRADLHHFAPVHHHQPVGLAQGRQAVSDGDRGAPFHQVVERLLDFLLGFGIDRRRGLVEDQDARVDQQRSRNADALALAARQPLAALTDQRVVAVRQPQDEIVRMGGTRCGDDVVARGVRPAIGNVLRNGAEEQEGLLQHQPDVTPVVGHGEAADVGAIDLDRAVGHVVETADQVDQRALARTAVTDQPDHLARLDHQVEVADDGAAAIAKTDPAHLDPALQGRRLAWRRRSADRDRVRRLGHVAHMVQDVEDALGAGSCFLRDRDDAAHRIEPRVEAPDVGDESRQHADRDVVVRQLPDTETPDHEQSDFGQQRHAGREQRPGAVEPVIHLQVVGIGRAKAVGLAPLLGKSLDDANARNRVGQHIGHFRPDAVDFLETGAQPVAHDVDHPGNEGQRQQGHQRQPGIGLEQDRRNHQQHHHVGRKIQRV